MLQLAALIIFLNYDIKILIMMQKLKPKTSGLKPKKTGHVDWVTVSALTGQGMEPQPPAPIAMSLITAPTDQPRSGKQC